jgi:hypothetical protein
MTDKYLRQLFAKAVKKNNPYCARCGCNSGLEAHHIVHVRYKVLRYDWKNGMTLCKECHKWAETLQGRDFIRDNHPHYTYIKNIQVMYKTFTEYCTVNNITEKEFMNEKLQELKKRLDK